MHQDFWNRGNNNPSLSQNLNSFLPDKDVLLLAALIYLLIKDAGNRELIMALVYIMM